MLRAEVVRSGMTLDRLAAATHMAKSRLSTYLGGRVPSARFVAAVIDATVDPRLRERRREEAARLLFAARNPAPPPAGPPGATEDGRPPPGERRSAGPVRVIGRLPARAGWLQERPEYGRLREALQGRDEAADRSGTVVLTGMGGVGKSQLAALHARSTREDGEVDVVLWVAASERQAVVSAYARAAAELFGAPTENEERAASVFLSALEPGAEPTDGPGPLRWLVVLDDVVSAGALRDLWPPDSPHGRTLVTSRSRDAALVGHGRRAVAVELFGPGRSLSYLRAALSGAGRDEPAEELARLADDLGHLPIALGQAAAMIVDAGIGVAAYRDRLADRARRLADVTPWEDQLPDGHASRLAALWDVSIEHADRQHPVGRASAVLRLCSVLAPSGVPAAVLAARSARQYAGCDPRDIELIAAAMAGDLDVGVAELPEQEAAAALRVLHRLHLVDHRPETPLQAVRIHRLVQRAVYDPMSASARRVLAWAAGSALLEVWPVERDTASSEAMRANTAALSAATGTDLISPGVHQVLFTAGYSLGRSGQVNAALSYFTALVGTITECLGPEHERTLIARGHEARWRGESGDLLGAVEAHSDILRSLSRVLGPDHEYTLEIRNNLAGWVGRAGDPVGALEHCTTLLAASRRAHGEDHPSTLAARHNLAEWLGNAGDAEGAAELCADLVARQTRAQGAEHPHTLLAKHNLAHWRAVSTRDDAGAMASYEQVVADARKVQGPDHPDTLLARHNLAGWRGRVHGAAVGLTAMTELLPDLERVHGPRHPFTFGLRSDLALFTALSGDRRGAARDYARLVEEMTETLGAANPRTVAAAAVLAALRAAADDPSADLTTVDDLRRAATPQGGAGAPDTTPGLRSLYAEARGAAGEPAVAARQYEALLAELIRDRGAEHPDALNAAAALAHWCAAMGEWDRAVQVREDLLERLRRAEAVDESAVVAAWRALAGARRAAGDPAGAVREHEALIAHLTRLQGPDAIRVLLARAELAHALADAGDQAAATAVAAELVQAAQGRPSPLDQLAFSCEANIVHWRSATTEPAVTAAAYAELIERVPRLPGGDETLRDFLIEQREHWKRLA